MLSDKGKRTLAELCTGIVVYGIVALAASVVVRQFFEFSLLPVILGMIIGMIVAIFMVFHMYHVLEKAILCDKKSAKRKTELGALLRMAVMAGVLVAGALLPDHISIIGVMIGILTLKIAALTQPLIDKVFSKYVKKEE